jgi:predicted dehydrogenase
LSARRVGILGLGSIGRRHARNLRALGEKVIAFDPSPAARQWFVEEFDRDANTREAVLNDADILVVASPSGCHLQDLEDAVSVRRPTLVEKPLGHDFQIARKIVERAEDKAVPIFVAHNLRYRSVLLRARELLNKGLIGKPIWAHFLCGSWLPDWRPQQDYRTNYAADREGGGVIFDVIHEIDLAFHLFGPAELGSAVTARSGLLEINTEDVADIVLRHHGGCQTSLHLDYVTRPRRRLFTIAGTEGILDVDLRTGALRATGRDENVVLDEVLPVEPNKEYLDEMEDFLSGLNGRKSPACKAREALAVLDLAVQARLAAGSPQPKADLARPQRVST